MTPVRTPAIVRGDVPGLLRRGMPTITLRAPAVVMCPDDRPPEKRAGAWCVAPVDEFPDDAGCSWSGLARSTDDNVIDYTDPAALYLSLHWLADRGHHNCLWMLPATHGGRVAEWDGLTAWEVSAIVVSVSVERVAAGKDPVPSVLCPWRHDPNPGDAYESWGWTAWMRDSVGDRGAARTYTPTRPTPDRWNGARWLYYRDRYGGVAPTRYGPETGDAGKLAADTAALADGCAICVPGGIVVPV